MNQCSHERKAQKTIALFELHGQFKFEMCSILDNKSIFLLRDNTTYTCGISNYDKCQYATQHTHIFRLSLMQTV